MRFIYWRKTMFLYNVPLPYYISSLWSSTNLVVSSQASVTAISLLVLPAFARSIVQRYNLKNFLNWKWLILSSFFIIDSYLCKHLFMVLSNYAFPCHNERSQPHICALYSVPSLVGHISYIFLFGTSSIYQLT